MAEIDKIVIVNIDRLTRIPSKKGFGTPMLFDINVKQSNEIDIIEEISDLEDIGFVAADAAHKAISSIFAQNPHVTQVKLAKRATNVAQVDTILITGADDGTYTVSLNGVDFSFVASSSTIELIRDGLIAAINAGGEPVTAAPVSTDTITLTADVAGTGFAIVFTSNPSDNMALTLTTPNTGIDSEIARIDDLDSDWYFQLMTSRTKQDILSASKTIESRIKLSVYATDEDDSKGLVAAGDTTSIMGIIATANRMRTIGMWTKTSNLSTFPDAGIVGLQGTTEGGSSTWKFKGLKNTAPDDELTPTEITNIEAKGGNINITVAEIAIFQQGTVADGEFIDNVRGTDQLSRRIQESVFGLFTTEAKVPFTDGGGDQLETALRDPLQEAEDNLFLAKDPKFTITIPKVATIAVADRAARFFKGVKFGGTLAGAVHSTKIDGTLSV